MRYALLSRFQGAVLGAMVGAQVEAQTGQRGQEYSAGRSPWIELMAAVADHLIRWGDLNLLEWQRQTKPLISGLRASDVTLSLLPMMLFFHEAPAKRHRMLRQAIATWQFPSEYTSDSVALSAAIAQILQEYPNPLTWVAHTIHDLQTSPILAPEPVALLVHSLSQVQAVLEPGISLEVVLSRLAPPPAQPGAVQNSEPHLIALAFYCFLSTPEDFRLSVLRAARMSQSNPQVCALVGALSGAYNSPSGIPLAWRLPLQRQMGTEWTDLTQRLWAAWSGVYQLELEAGMPGNLYPAVAAPGIMRSR